MGPGWLLALSIISLLAGCVCAGIILLDVRQRPQAMAVMNPVWPVTALYMGPLGLWAYWRLGRAPPKAGQTHHHHQHHDSQRPFWAGVFGGTTHCGAGCTLGDILAECLGFAAGLRLAGSAFAASLTLDYALAFLLGIVFQYFSIVPMRGLAPLPGILAAVKADALSLTAFEVGMFAWMALTRFVLFSVPLQPDNPIFWFMMQIGMVIGFATAYPMNWWLIRAGIKEPCM